MYVYCNFCLYALNSVLLAAWFRGQWCHSFSGVRITERGTRSLAADPAIPPAGMVGARVSWGWSQHSGLWASLSGTGKQDRLVSAAGTSWFLPLLILVQFKYLCATNPQKAWNRSVKCPCCLGLLGCWNVKGWITISSDSCGSRGFYVGNMALKQWWCLSASVLSVPVSQEQSGSALFLAVSNVTSRLSADRCPWAYTVLTYIINSSLKRTFFLVST